ncbi:MAG: nitroreductase [Dysgonomonas sp.]|nr:nitroreductase [Dysgonomonas sp.]
MNAQNNDFRKMIGYAVKAPSGHNTQPWKFKIGIDHIQIYPDTSKTLPVVDADHRELYISLGCAAENLCLTANALGYNPQINIDADGVITIYLEKGENISVSSLFNQIEKRQTNRSVYDNGMIPNDLLALCMSEIEDEENIHIYMWEKGSAVFDTLKQAVIEGNIVQMDDKVFTDELKLWMRYNKKQSDSQQDGLSYHIYGAPNLPSWISKPVMGSYLNSKKQNKGDIKKMESSSHFVLITSQNESKEEWIHLGMHMERFLLKLTEVGIAHAYMNQPCEVKELKGRLRQTLPVNNEIPQILIRVGYAKAASYSKRKSIDEVIIGEE